MARAFSGELEAAAARPFPFATADPRACAGTDSLAPMLRAAVELEPHRLSGWAKCFRHHQPRDFTCQATRYRPVAPALRLANRTR